MANDKNRRNNGAPSDEATGDVKPTISQLIDSAKFSRAHAYAIAATTFAFFFDAFDTSLMAIALPSVTKEFTLDGTTAGALAGAIFWGMAGGAICIGFLADILGRRWVLIGGLLGMSLSTMLCGFAPNIAVFFVLRVLVGVFAGALIPISLSYLAEIAPVKSRGMILGSIGLSWPLGAILANLVGGWIIPVGGWRWVFFVGIVPAIICLVMFRWVIESPRWLAQRHRWDDAVTAANHLGCGVETAEDVDFTPELVKIEKPSMLENLRILFQKRYAMRTVGASLMYFLKVGSDYGWTTFIPTIIMTVLGYPLTQTVQVTVIIYAASFLGRLTVMLTANWLPRVANMLISMGLYMVIALVMPSIIGTGDATWIVVFFALFQFAGDTAIIFQMWTPELFPSSIRAFSTSFCSSWGRIASGFMPIIFGSLVLSGNTGAVFYVVAGFAAAIAGTVLITLRTSETQGRSLTDTKSD